MLLMQNGVGTPFPPHCTPICNQSGSVVINLITNIMFVVSNEIGLRLMGFMKGQKDDIFEFMVEKLTVSWKKNLWSLDNCKNQQKCSTFVSSLLSRVSTVSICL